MPPARDFASPARFSSFLTALDQNCPNWGGRQHLELPSTPLLAPEFRNPLFLTTLCRGLSDRGEHRLPRGFQGITAIFELYLSAVNTRLASTLGFNPKTHLVGRALEVVSDALAKADQRWLPLSKAEEMVNALLPNREFERSLYRGLVVEGILVEESSWRQEAPREEVVFISYERFADHLAAKTLLDKHLDPAKPADAFSAGQPLAFLCDEQVYLETGLLEAMCIQVAERTGRELVALAPGIMSRSDVSEAFRQSLIWRATSAYSDETRNALNEFCQSDEELHDTLDVLLTVATLPEHPFNAAFLDKQLRAETMPERDAWWSIYLHHAWSGQGAVDRLVDWASSIVSSTIIEDETVDLCSTALAWMLTTSNRHLRDRATKSLVSLLTGRLSSVIRLVERFADIDDPYVTERVYAVAYGTAMLSHIPVEVGALATIVYKQVFESSSPPAHILLRDYARGVVERAIYLGCDIKVDATRIRPPYSSKWPTIPTEKDIESLVSNWDGGDDSSDELDWARNRIVRSVLDDDFAFYVIGTNSSSTSDKWLALKLDEPRWQAPARPEDRLRDLVAKFSDVERRMWEVFEKVDRAHADATSTFVSGWFSQREKLVSSDNDDLVDPEELTSAMDKVRPPEVIALEEKREAAADALDAVLTEENKQHLREVLAAQAAQPEEPARFELGLIQRFILRRVFELGWTTERFGHFDRYSVGDHDREASKPERIGKKYQWIAYHEIMALVADHFQYCEQYHEHDGDQAYEGPWQDMLRNIDPSCTLRSARGGTQWDSHTLAWWGSTRYENWGAPSQLLEWVMKCDDLPSVDGLISVTNPSDSSRWLNAQGSFIWKQQAPADRDSTDVDRRELWYICTGYLIREVDAQAFMQWAEGVDFRGQWMTDSPEFYPTFLGEHGWSPAFNYFQKRYFSDRGWTQPKYGCPVRVCALALDYLSSGDGFDCSLDKTFRLRLPTSELMGTLGIRWRGNTDFIDMAGKLAVQDPTAHSDGPSALLLREDLLRECLARDKLTVVWTLVGEKRELGRLFSRGRRRPTLTLSGAYLLQKQGPVGFVKCVLDNPAASTLPLAPLKILRSVVP